MIEAIYISKLSCWRPLGMVDVHFSKGFGACPMADRIEDWVISGGSHGFEIVFSFSLPI